MDNGAAVGQGEVKEAMETKKTLSAMLASVQQQC